ncbi:MAG: hypothetical protein AAGJ83_01350 [Planctomycetota bacterium]
MQRTKLAIVLCLTLTAAAEAQSSRRRPSTIFDRPTGAVSDQTLTGFAGSIASELSTLEAENVAGEPCNPGLASCDRSRIDFRSFMPISKTKSPCDVGRPCFQSCFASVKSVFFSRSADDFEVSYDVGGGNTRGTSLNHGLTPGIEATLAMRTGPTGRVEVSYLGINEWSSDNRSDNVAFGGGPGRLSSFDSYNAGLNDLQFNLVAMDPYANWDWLVGFRVIDQRDDAESLLSLDDGMGTVLSERVFADASNTLFGFQAGTRYARSFGLLTFDSGAKLGVFHNETSQTGTVFAGAIIVDGIPEATFDTDGGEVSVMGDFFAQLAYRVTSSSEIHLGYRGMIFSDIVQSTQRDGQSADPTGLGYHGITCGLTLYR